MVLQQAAHTTPDHQFVCGATEEMTHEVCGICKADMSVDQTDVIY